MTRQNELNARDGLAQDIMKGTPQQQEAARRAAGGDSKKPFTSEDAHRIAGHAAREADKRRGGK